MDFCITLGIAAQLVDIKAQVTDRGFAMICAGGMSFRPQFSANFTRGHRKRHSGLRFHGFDAGFANDTQ